MDIRQAQSLVELSTDARVLALASEFQDGASSLALRPKLEAHFSVETCLAILECWSVRERFRSKFDKVDDWLLLREAAEQATPSLVAQWRASFLKQRFPDSRTLTEIGCGIGGDTVFLGRDFLVTSYEADPARAALASANVATITPPPASTQSGPKKAQSVEICSEEVDFTSLEGDLLFLDPARRTHKRVLNPEEWTPALSEILAFEKTSKFSAICVKCAPGLDLSLLPATAEVHFLSLGRDLKEAFVLLAGEGRLPTAWVIEGKDTLQLSGSDEEIPSSQPEPGHFLHNPNPAVVRGQALATLCKELDATLVHPKIAYLWGPRPCLSPAAASFLILETFSLNWKTLKKKLLETDWSDYEFLKRGTPFSQQDLRKKLEKTHKSMRQRRGPRGSLVIYRDQDDYRVILGRRLNDR